MDRIGDDFTKRYNYRPLLIENFVDTNQYSGVSCKAANLLEVGKTKGRGRQDRYSAHAQWNIFWLLIVNEPSVGSWDSRRCCVSRTTVSSTTPIWINVPGWAY